ncbi:hypothetical protein FHS85_004585 [Rhodoligotrophos appendicifer]|uniref:hypothetical protein n=1 Tax=Rhodoligotrophos appendicifer TaxID=987056 RepID=UPI001184A20B|nr:hypothetical protein [Rhodoligotrophos appendicifer]
MASTDSQKHHYTDARHRGERREAMYIFCLLYPFCLVASIGGRLFRRRGPAALQPWAARPSIFKEAKTAAASCIPFVFW